MLYAIALQAGRNVGGSGVASRQVILVPAAGLAFGRRISNMHPRKPWQPIDFHLDEKVWGWSSVQRDFEKTDWTRPAALPTVDDDYTWQPMMDVPVLFHVKDDEYVAMRRGEIPRNVVLRYQRALEAHSAVLLGAGAVTVDEAVAALNQKHHETESTLSKAPGTTMMARLVNVLAKVDEAIRENRTNMLDNYVPREARAKGAGAHRNHDNLPELVDVAPEAPAAPYVAPAPVVVTGGGVVKPGDTLVRPNGMPYMAREVKDLDVKGGISDVQLFRHAHKAGVHTLLWGPPGTGKTAGLEVAFPGMVAMIGTPETEADDFLGQYVAVLGEDGREILVWEDGPMVKAAEAGVPLFVDEIGLIPSNQIAPLLGVMDGRREIRIVSNPARGVVQVKEGFTVVAAFNPSTARHVSEALLSRFGLKIEHSTDYSAARALGCNPRLVDAAEHMNAQMGNGELGWAPQMRELLQARDDEALLGIVYAVRNLCMNAPEMERPLIVGHLKERLGDIPGAARKIRPLTI